MNQHTEDNHHNNKTVVAFILGVSPAIVLPKLLRNHGTRATIGQAMQTLAPTLLNIALPLGIAVTGTLALIRFRKARQSCEVKSRLMLEMERPHPIVDYEESPEWSDDDEIRSEFAEVELNYRSETDQTYETSREEEAAAAREETISSAAHHDIKLCKFLLLIQELDQRFADAMDYYHDRIEHIFIYSPGEATGCLVEHLLRTLEADILGEKLDGSAESGRLAIEFTINVICQVIDRKLKAWRQQLGSRLRMDDKRVYETGALAETLCAEVYHVIDHLAEIEYDKAHWKPEYF